MTDNLTIKRQRYRNSYMESLAKMPEPPTTPEEQSPQADRWWPGTQKSKWEKGRWVLAPEWCDKDHKYGEGGWRPAGKNRHEHWEYPDE